MEFERTETQKIVQETARKFAAADLRPNARARDEKEAFPVEVIRQLASLGLMGVNIPADLGGSEAGVVAYSLAVTEISAGDGSIGVTMCVNNMVAEVIAAFGTEAQKQAYIPNLMNGTSLAGSFCLSEAGAGSDPAAMKTRAVKTESGWTINGTKAWITSGAYAGVFLVWAQTDIDGKDRITTFLVDPKSDGISVGKPERKMGQHASNTCALAFDDVQVGEDAILGELGQGFRIAMMALDGGRIGIASQALGIAEEALRCSREYVQQRAQFGSKIAEFQATQFKLADMATQIEAARALTMRAAWMKEQGDRRFSREASMAKLFSSEAACRICDEAIQLHGGYGYTKEFLPEKLMRDVRVTRIYEGTSEIQRIVIARELLQKNG